MNQEQKLAHERMLNRASMLGRLITHWKMFPDSQARLNKVSQKARSEAGRKGRLAANLATPVRLNGSWEIPVLKRKKKL